MPEFRLPHSKAEISGTAAAGAGIALGVYGLKKALDHRRNTLNYDPTQLGDYSRLATLLDQPLPRLQRGVTRVAAYLAARGCSTRREIIDGMGLNEDHFADGAALLAPKRQPQTDCLIRRVDRQGDCATGDRQGTNHYEPTANLIAICNEGLGGPDFLNLVAELSDAPR